LNHNTDKPVVNFLRPQYYKKGFFLSVYSIDCINLLAGAIVVYFFLEKELEGVFTSTEGLRKVD